MHQSKALGEKNTSIQYPNRGLVKQIYEQARLQRQSGLQPTSTAATFSNQKSQSKTLHMGNNPQHTHSSIGTTQLQPQPQPQPQQSSSRRYTPFIPVVSIPQYIVHTPHRPDEKDTRQSPKLNEDKIDTSTETEIETDAETKLNHIPFQPIGFNLTSTQHEALESIAELYKDYEPTMQELEKIYTSETNQKFTFQPRTLRPDWNMLSEANLGQIIVDRSFKKIEKMLPSLIYCDIAPHEMQSLQNSPEKYLKLIRLHQMSMEYLVYSRKIAAKKATMFQREALALHSENMLLRSELASAQEKQQSQLEKIVRLGLQKILYQCNSTLRLRDRRDVDNADETVDDMDEEIEILSNKKYNNTEIKSFLDTINEKVTTLCSALRDAQRYAKDNENLKKDRDTSHPHTQTSQLSQIDPLDSLKILEIERENEREQALFRSMLDQQERERRLRAETEAMERERNLRLEKERLQTQIDLLYAERERQASDIRQAQEEVLDLQKKLTEKLAQHLHHIDTRDSRDGQLHQNQTQPFDVNLTTDTTQSISKKNPNEAHTIVSYSSPQIVSVPENLTQYPSEEVVDTDDFKLFFSCMNLPKQNWFSLCDPFLVILTAPISASVTYGRHLSDEWNIHSVTPVVWDSSNPVWPQPILIRWPVHQDLGICIQVWDAQSKEAMTVMNYSYQDFVGSATISLLSIASEVNGKIGKNWGFPVVNSKGIQVHDSYLKIKAISTTMEQMALRRQREQELALLREKNAQKAELLRIEQEAIQHEAKLREEREIVLRKERLLQNHKKDIAVAEKGLNAAKRRVKTKEQELEVHNEGKKIHTERIRNMTGYLVSVVMQVDVKDTSNSTDEDGSDDDYLDGGDTATSTGTSTSRRDKHRNKPTLFTVPHDCDGIFAVLLRTEMQKTAQGVRAQPQEFCGATDIHTIDQLRAFIQGKVNSDIDLGEMDDPDQGEVDGRDDGDGTLTHDTNTLDGRRVPFQSKIPFHAPYFEDHILEIHLYFKRKTEIEPITQETYELHKFIGSCILNSSVLIQGENMNTMGYSHTFISYPLIQRRNPSYATCKLKMEQDHKMTESFRLSANDKIEEYAQQGAQMQLELQSLRNAVDVANMKIIELKNMDINIDNVDTLAK